MKTKIICGIEEAGRGPVIGPMIMVGCTIKAKDEQLLKNCPNISMMARL